MTGLYSAELFAKKAGMEAVKAVKAAPLFKKIQPAKEAYGVHAIRKPRTIRTHIRVTSFSAFCVDAESCCWAAACGV